MVLKPPRRVDLIAQAFTARMFREIEQHVEQRAGFWLAAVVAEMFPGESVELYGAKVQPTTRVERQERIAQALASGTPPAEVAKRERVTERHVRRIRGRLGHPPP